MMEIIVRCCCDTLYLSQLHAHRISLFVWEIIKISLHIPHAAACEICWSLLHCTKWVRCIKYQQFLIWFARLPETIKLGNSNVVEHLKSTEINLEWIYYSQYLLVARSEWICFENIMANFISNLEKSSRFEKCRKGCSELDSNGVAMLGQRRRARAQLAGKYKFDIPASFNINIINLDGRENTWYFLTILRLVMMRARLAPPSLGCDWSTR